MRIGRPLLGDPGPEYGAAAVCDQARCGQPAHNSNKKSAAMQRRDESIVYDFVAERGIVRARVALVPRSTEILPAFSRFAVAAAVAALRCCTPHSVSVCVCVCLLRRAAHCDCPCACICVCVYARSQTPNCVNSCVMCSVCVRLRVYMCVCVSSLNPSALCVCVCVFGWLAVCQEQCTGRGEDLVCVCVCVCVRVVVLVMVPK